MNLDRLKFVKNIDDTPWAYQSWKINQEAQLNWPKGSETNADKAQKGDLVLLIQKPESISEARITHLVEILTEQSEKTDQDEWNIIRKVRPLWIADFNHETHIPTERAIFGWNRHRNRGPNLVALENIQNGKVIEIWHSLEIFRRHIAGMLNLTEA